MTKSLDAPTSLPARFRSKAFAWICLWFITVQIFGIAMGIIWIRREGLLGGLLFLIIWCLLVGLIGGVTLLGKSDIVIDENSISRTIFGKTWQLIKWKDVGKITEFLLVDPGSNLRARTIRSFNIFPAIKTQGSLFPTGKMFFNEKMENKEVLLALINRYIREYSIKVESTVSGKRVDSNHL